MLDIFLLLCSTLAVLCSSFCLTIETKSRESEEAVSEWKQTQIAHVAALLWELWGSPGNSGQTHNSANNEVWGRPVRKQG